LQWFLPGVLPLLFVVVVVVVVCVLLVPIRPSVLLGFSFSPSSCDAQGFLWQGY